MNILSFAEAQKPSPAAEIEGTKLLIGEGSHEASFFKALLAHMSIENIQVGHYGGKDRLRLFLKTLRNIRGFRDLAQIGITRDADDCHEAAFDSVCSALENENFVPPDRPGEFSAGLVQSGAFVLPDNAGPGMMETLCLRSVQDDPTLECVSAFFECIQQKAQRGPDPSRLDKARAHAYLASKPVPDKNPGLAALEGYWNLDGPALGPLKDFVRALSEL